MGSAIVPSDQYQDDMDDTEINAEIEAVKRASIGTWQESLKPHLLRLDEILDTDSADTVFHKAFEGYEALDQVQTDEIIAALHEKVSDDTLAQVIRVVERLIIPAKWPIPAPEDCDTSRRSIQ
eukprot:6465290-Amphidinium_carterae.1